MISMPTPPFPQKKRTKYSGQPTMSLVILSSPPPITHNHPNIGLTAPRPSPLLRPPQPFLFILFVCYVDFLYFVWFVHLFYLFIKSGKEPECEKNFTGKAEIDRWWFVTTQDIPFHEVNCMVFISVCIHMSPVKRICSTFTDELRPSILITSSLRCP